MKPMWNNRNLRLLVLGQASSLVGNYTLKFALFMYIMEVTGSAALFATFLSVAMVPTIVLSPFGGILADRGDRRRIMVTLDACAGLAVLLAALTLPLGHALGVIGALLVVLSVLGAFESPTVQACVPQMLEGEDLVRGNAVVAQVQAVASLATPFLGSVLYAAVGLVPVLWGAAGCFLVTALLECFLQLPPPAPVEGLGVREVLKQDLAASGRFLWREEPGMLKLLLLAALVSFFLAGILVVGFPFLVRTVLGLSATHYGGAESALGVAAVLGSLWVGLLAGKLRPVHLGRAIGAVGLCLLPVGLAFLLPLGTLGRYGVLVAGFCLCQFGCSFFSTYAIAAIQGRTPASLMGKVMSCVYTLSLCAQPLGQLVYGALFDRFAGQVFWVLLPTALVVCAVGLATRGFFQRWEGQTSAER